MGKVRIVGRLVVRDLRRHPAQAVLLLLAITAATSILTLGLALHGVTSQPYEQTRAATSGPDVVAQFRPGPIFGSTFTRQQAAAPHGPGAGDVARQVSALVRSPGVTGYSGPYPVASPILHARGLTAGVEVEGRDQARALIDQPTLTAGSWVRPGGVVLERTFADALGVGVGDRVTLNGRPYQVAGIAVTAAEPPYPNVCYSLGGGCVYNNPNSPTGHVGFAWATEQDARALGSSPGGLSYLVYLKLNDSAQAQAFALSYDNAHQAPGSPNLIPWQSLQAAAGLLVRDQQDVLSVGAWLAGVLAVASVAVLAGGRMAEHTRRVGLLKAVGGTPGLVAVVLLAENLLVALAAAAAGLLAGWLAAPLITNPGAGLVGSPGAPSLTLTTAGLVIGVAFAVALAATLVPALRASRTSTVSALADAARRPRRRPTLIKLSRRLPVPLLLGLRLVARRPRRAVLGAASIAVTVTGLVAVVAFHTMTGEKRFSSAGLSDPVINRDEQMLLVLTVALVALAVLNAVFTAWAAALDAQRSSALARALGATPQQVSGGLAAAQALPALAGALVGIPLGILLFKAANGSGQAVVPSAAWLAMLTVATLAGVVLLTNIPARIAGRRPSAEVLQSETA